MSEPVCSLGWHFLAPVSSVSHSALACGHFEGRSFSFFVYLLPALSLARSSLSVT